MDQAIFEPLHRAHCRSVCASCNLREICLPYGLTRMELDYVDKRLVAARRKVRRGAHLYRVGDRFDSVFAVWTGSFKSCVSSPDGREQVTGFQLGGDLLGLDGIESSAYTLDAMALEDSQVCVIRFDDLQELAQEVSSLQQQLQRIMSREIVRTHGAMLLLGSMYADERVAAFMLNLMHRLRERGFSGTAVSLRMSREEIASFLGMKLGTISRSFSRLQDRGLLFVRKRQVQIVDPLGLQQLLDGSAD
jgi:CRP/FNR family transcriptional regulator